MLRHTAGVVRPEIVGTAVLLDYPVRLWARQRAHHEEVLREFTLMLGGSRDGVTRSAPQRHLELAELVTRQYAAESVALDRARQQALDAGADRLDLEVPITTELPHVVAHVREVFDAVDEFCRQGAVLALPRSPEVAALMDWMFDELLAQHGGAAPTPWPGPF